MKCKSTVAVILGAIFIFALGATRAAYAATPPNACSLLTAAQVSAVLGVPVRPPAGPTRLDCMWAELGAPPRGKGKGVMLTILGTLGPKLTPMDRFNNAKKGGPFKGTPTTISGLGDDAVYLTGSAGNIQLYVKKGSLFFKVRVLGFPPEQINEKEKTLAHDVLAKL